MSGCAADDRFAISSGKEKNLLMWVLKWFAKDHERRTNGALDIMEFVQLLQCAGYQLNKLEHNASSVTKEPIKLRLTCGRSGINATMSFTSVVPCSCPSRYKFLAAVHAYRKFDHAKYGFIADIFKVLASILSQTDTNRNELTVTAHGAWEVDPTTPPRNASSPVPDISKSTNIKLQNSLKQIQTLAASSLEILGCSENATTKRVSDIKPLTPAQEAASTHAKPSTPARRFVYKNVTSKVDSYRTKPSPMTTGRQVPKKEDQCKTPIMDNKAKGLLKTKITSGIALRK